MDSATEASIAATEGVERTIAEIARLEGELNLARARLKVYRAEARKVEQMRLCKLRHIDVAEVEDAASPSSPQDVGPSHEDDSEIVKKKIVKKEPQRVVEPQPASSSSQQVAPLMVPEEPPSVAEPQPASSANKQVAPLMVPGAKVLAGGKRKREAVPAGVCAACHNLMRNLSQGKPHDYGNINCTNIPTREPFRTRALQLRADAKMAAGLDITEDELKALESTDYRTVFSKEPAE